MVRRLTHLVALVRQALALTIVASIIGALIGELWARARGGPTWTPRPGDRITRAPGGWLVRPAGPRSPGQPDWYAARALASEAEFYKLHPIDLTETVVSRPADAAE